jgi:SAM-dependent methyltransferase
MTVGSGNAGRHQHPLQRAHALISPALRPRGLQAGDHVAGYLDLLPAEGLPSTGRSQDLMTGRVLPAVYERVWRPTWGAIATGVLGPSMADEKRIARLLLGLTPGDGVLDVACGPGNFTRDLGRVVGSRGIAIGLDASASMLARAVADTDPVRHPAVGYVRGDAEHLPFRDESFDAVNCFAALYLMGDPFAAIAELARVLTPGGRVAIFTSCRTRSAPLRTVDGILGGLAAIRMFERDEITGALAAHGLLDVRRRVTGLTQFVGGRKPA